MGEWGGGGWVGDRQVKGESVKQKGRRIEREKSKEIIRRIIKSRKELFDCMLLFFDHYKEMVFESFENISSSTASTM